MRHSEDYNMKTFKRILAVVLLVVAVLVVGYLCYTGSRLAATLEEMSCLQDTCKVVAEDNYSEI